MSKWAASVITIVALNAADLTENRMDGIFNNCVTNFKGSPINQTWL